MSMYGLIFGRSQVGAALEALIVHVHDIDSGRFRDAFVETHGDQLVIRILTRNGGGNRQDQRDAIESMRSHPWFKDDNDERFDSTYASFRFVVDPQHEVFQDEEGREILEGLVRLAQGPIDMSERFQQALQEFDRHAGPARKRLTEKLRSR